VADAASLTSDRENGVRTIGFRYQVKQDEMPVPRPIAASESPGSEALTSSGSSVAHRGQGSSPEVHYEEDQEQIRAAVVAPRHEAGDAGRLSPYTRSRTTTTGQSACRTQCSVTDPRSILTRAL
jgi:hypothetical protein